MLPTPLNQERKGLAHEGKGFNLGKVVRDRPQDLTSALTPQSLPHSDTPAAVLLQQERGQGNTALVLAL